jgi:tRNA_anti-like
MTTDTEKTASLTRRFLPWFAGGLVVAAVLSAMTSGTTKTTASVKPPLAVSVTHLTGDYAENILAAQKRYEGRPVKVSGNIDHIETSGSTVRLRFVVPGTINGVRAEFEDGKIAGLEATKPGDWVTVLCSDVHQGALVPELDECEFQRPGLR